MSLIFVAPGSRILFNICVIDIVSRSVVGFGPNISSALKFEGNFRCQEPCFPNKSLKNQRAPRAETSRWMKGSLNLGNPSKLLFCCEGMVYQNLL